MVSKLALLSSVIAGASASIPVRFLDQVPLDTQAGLDSEFTCNLPQAIDPAGDGLPSADSLFSSDEALDRQIKRHQAVVRVPSVSYDDNGSPGEDERWAPFYDLHKVLEDLYPNVYRRAKLEKINTLGLLFTIQGSEPDLAPILLAAHQDVVPVADESTWTHPPFEAVYDGEWLWGRGASDDKNSLTALMSAVDTMMSYDDWAPKRTVILAFGFDEECSGYRGAGHIATHLTERYGDDGIAIILDEGGLGNQLLNDTLYALPAVMEKGHVDIWITLHLTGGHSSIPSPHTGIGIMAEIITALEAHPYEAQLIKDSPVHRHLQCLARYSPDADPQMTKLVRKNDLKGLTKLLVDWKKDAQFMIQTSQAVDMIQGGQKINAMPETISLGVNYRVAPQDSIPKVQHNVVKYIQKVIKKYNLRVKAFGGDDDFDNYNEEAVYLKDVLEEMGHGNGVDYNATLILEAREKSKVTPISPTSGPVWDTFSGTIQHSFAFDGTVVPVGEIMTGNTDTRHYLNLSPNVYRWTPNMQEGSENIHTINERVRMDMHMRMVKFYYNFVRNFDQVEIEM